MRRLFAFYLLCFSWLAAMAQTELVDSVPLNSENLQVDTTILTPILNNQPFINNEPLFSDSISTQLLWQPNDYYANFLINPSVIYSPLKWRNFQVSGYMSQNDYLGLMGVESGSLVLQYSNNKVSLYVGGVVNKYGFYRGLYTQKGITANLSYRLTTNLSATLFGTYYGGNDLYMANGAPMLPAMLGFYNVSRFGGYVDCRISDSFGVQTGAQVVQQVGPRTHYHIEPIVTPYFKVGKVWIGLPVGQILNGVVRDQVNRRRRPR